MTNTPTPGAAENEFHWTPEGIRRSEERAPERPAVPAPGAPTPDGHAEHRRYPRIDLRVPILYKVLSEEPTLPSAVLHPYSAAKTDNLSPSGVGLVLAERLPLGTLLALSLHLEDRRKISIVARVVWSQPTETPHHHLTGLEFIVIYRRVQARTEYMNPSVLKDLLEPS